MLRMIGTGVAMFGALLISSLLMEIFGEPILASVPTGTWGLEWLVATAEWLLTSEALFWWLAAATLLLAIVAWRSSWLTQTSSVVSTITLSIGFLTGVAYRLMHADAIASNLAADPAFWFLATGALAPFALWALRRPAEAAIGAILDSLDNRQERRARKGPPEPALMIRPPGSVAPEAMQDIH